jgi:hypothetical protein
MEDKMNISNETMAGIHRDMDVYDVHGDKVGSVEFVQMGDEDPANAQIDATSDQRPEIHDSALVDTMGRVLAPGEVLPEEMIARLRRYGYIRINFGLLRSDRFASHDQIASVGADRVTLNVPGDALLKA